MKYNELSHIRSVNDVRAYLNYIHTERNSILFNGGEGANFIYRISFPDATKFNVNSFNDYTSTIQNGKGIITNRILELENNYNAQICFKKIQSSILNRNMIMTDTGLPLLVAEMLLICFRKEKYSVVDCINATKEKNPLDWDFACCIPFYEYKVMNFLQDCALGLSSNEERSGSYIKEGGIVVKEREEDVRYYIYDFDMLRKVLFETAFFEQSTINVDDCVKGCSSLNSSENKSFGYVYEENGLYYMNLNLQLRLRK